MKREIVQSSNLRSVGYDQLNEILEVEFNQGGIYQYSKVPLAIFHGLMKAPSKGQFFANFIRAKYLYRKIS